MSKKNSVGNTSLIFEELEPRLLLSADGLAVITESSVATFQNIVHSENEHTIIVQQHDEQVSTAVLDKVQSGRRTELVILDSRAPNFQQLHNDIIKAQQQGRDINVVILDAHRDGLEQISEALNKYNKLDAVHIVSHGSDSRLQLGATQLDRQSIQHRSEEIEAWKHVFADDGDLLIYGCNLADTQDGKSMVDTLSRLTATDVAASDDLTGNQLLGGDWDLEYEVGEVETQIAFSQDIQSQWQGSLASPVANNDSYSITEDQTLVINALNDSATSTSIDLIAAWQLDEGAGSTTFDATGNGIDGTVNGATWTPSSRTGDSALSFDGINDSISLGSDPAIDNIFSGGGTISAWINPAGWGLGDYGRILDKSGDTIASDGWALQLNGNDGSLRFEHGFDSNNGGWQTESDTISLGSWQHVAVVYDNSSAANDPQIYINGVLQTISEDRTPSGTADSDAAQDLAMGAYPLDSIRNFDGVIDEVAIYNRDLSGTEISALFSTGVIANDTDSDGDALTASVVTTTSHGSLSLNTDGSFTYIPDADFSGNDSFTYKVNDGTSDSNIATVIITVTPVNDVPILDLDVDNSSGATGLDYDTTYIEAGGAVSVVDTDFLLIDADDSIDSITVTLTNNQVNAPNKEILAASDEGTGLAINYDGKEILTISGTASVADYQSVLATLTYDNLVNNPDTTPRVITFVVNDGTVDSLIATTTVAVQQSTKPPTNTVPGALTVAEDTPLAISGISVKDTDNNLTTVSLTVNSGSLNVTVIGGVTISSGTNGSNTLTLTGGTETEFNDTLATLVYQGDLNFNGADSLTIFSTDALGGVDSDSVSITVTPVDDAPVASDDPGDYGSDMTALNPVSYWQFGEAGGGTATDIGSAGVSASLNGATFGQPGAINGDAGTAAGFDGVDDYGVIAHDSSYELDEGSIQLWFNADDVNTQQGLISKDSNGFDNGGHFTIRIMADGSIQTRLQSTTQSYYVSSAPGSVTAGDWHHVAVNFGSGGMELFLDGVSVDTNAYTGGLGSTSGGSGNNEPIAIGGSTVNSDDGSVLRTGETTPRDLFAGRIDEVAIVGQALTAEQIQDLYATAQQNYNIAEDSSLVVSASEGVLINDTDIEGDALTAVLVAGPSNASSFTLNADGSFNYTPVANFSGTDTFTYVANDGTSDSNMATVTINISGDNDAPVNTVPGGPLVVLEDTQTAIPGISVTDADAGTGIISTQLSVTNGVLDVTLSGLATISAGANSSNTLTISGNVTDINNTLASLQYTGDTNVNGIAADSLTIDTNDLGNTGIGGAKSDNDTVQINITSVNDAPTVANAIADVTVDEDAAPTIIEISSVFADVDIATDADSLSYSAVSSDGTLVTTSITGTDLTLTYAAGQSGSATVTVTATDANGPLAVADPFTVTVNAVNDAPTVEAVIPDQTLAEDFASYTIDLNAAFTDEETADASLVYSVAGNTNINVSIASGIATITPTANWNGSETLTFSATDAGGLSVNQAVLFTVNPANDAPTVANSIPDQVATEDSAFTFTFAANTFNDVDGDTLTYTSDASGWLSFNAGTRTFSGTPLNGDVGTTTVTVTADDGKGGTISDTFDIVIGNTNDAPTVANSIPDQVATEDTAFSFQFAANTFNDVDGDTLTYTSDAAGWLSFNAGTRTFSGTPLNGDVGTTTVTVTADDGNGGTISDTFDIVISNTNDAPTVANSIPDQVAAEDSAFSFTFAANTFNDVDGDTLTYTSDAAGWLSFNAGTRTFSGTPLNGDVGTTTVTVTADDGNGGTVSDTFDIVISNTNDAPTVANSVPDQVAMEDSVFTFTFAANTFNDVDGDTLTYTSDASGWLSFNAGTRTFSGTPLNADVGTTTVTVTAVDGNGGSVSESFDIAISNTNDAPTATNLNAAENYFEDTVLNLTDIVVSDVDSANVMVTLTLSDVSAGTLSTATSNAVTSTFAAGVWSASGAIDDVNNLLSGLTFTPSQNYNSNFNIIPRVDDFGVLPPATGNKVMTGTALNDIPTVVNSIADQVATEDTPFSFQFANNTFNDVDGDSLTYTSDAAGWLSFNAGTRTFSGTPLNADVGTTTVTVTADDGNGGTVSDTFDIVISNTNDAPTVANAIADQVATEDSAFTFTFAANTFNDVDGDTLTYTSDASGWLSFNAGTRTFSGTPLNGDVGTTTVTVTVDDGKGGSVSDTFDIVISNTNDVAIIGGDDTGSVTEDDDPDANTLLETGGALTVMDPDVGESSFIAQTINGSYGDLIIGATGVWNYSADNTQVAIQNLAATDTLTDSFNVTSFDGTTHNVVITIGGVNDAPTALDDNPVVDEGGTAIFDLAINDVDIDNAINLSSISITGAPANGSLIVNSNGTVTYTHDGSETTSDIFSYTIADITGAISNIATVNIKVNPLNDSPSAQDDAQSVDEGNTVVIDLSANDTDADNALDLSSIVIVTEPTNGTYIVNSNGTVEYTHDGSQTLSDSFSYTISDISGAVSNTATVNIIVNPINNAPTTIGIVDVTVFEDSPVTNIDLNAAFDDADNLDSELTYSITGNTSIGLFSSAEVNAATGELVLDYAADMNGSSQISIRATDPSGASVDTIFTVTVTPVNDAPVLASNIGMTVQGTASTVISSSELNVNDIDDTDAVIIYTVTALPENGVLLLNGVPLAINSSFTEEDIINNNLSYQSSGTNATDQFEFTVSDSQGATIANNIFNIVVQLVIPEPEVMTTTFEPDTSTEIEVSNVPASSEGDGSDFNSENTTEVRHIEDLYTGGASAMPIPPKLTLEPAPKTEPEKIEQDLVDDYDESIELYEPSKLNFSTASTVADIQIRSMKALLTAIDEMKEQIDENIAEDITEVEFRAAAVSSSGVALTAGIVAWVLRSGALMTSLISTIPLWKGYDPLPILAYNNDEDEDEDEDITEDKIPASLEELKKIKALKEKMKKYNQVDDLFGGTEAEG